MNKIDIVNNFLSCVSQILNDTSLNLDKSGCDALININGLTTTELQKSLIELNTSKIFPLLADKYLNNTDKKVVVVKNNTTQRLINKLQYILQSFTESPIDIFQKNRTNYSGVIIVRDTLFSLLTQTVDNIGIIFVTGVKTEQINDVHKRFIVMTLPDNLNDFCKKYDLEKDGNWLSATDLKKYIKHNNHKRISDTLEQLFESPNRPEWCQKRHAMRRQIICIRANMVNDFCKTYGLTPINNIKKLEKKDDNWLSASNLIRHHIANGTKYKDKIITELNNLFNSVNRPEWCNEKLTGHNPVICIRADMLNEFCKLSGLKPRNNIKKLEKKDENWLSPSDLINHHITNGSRRHKEITDALNNLFNLKKRPKWCKKTLVGRHQIIYIQADMVKEFCERYKFKQKKQYAVKPGVVLKKDKNWLCSTDLKRYHIISGTSHAKQITDALNKLAESPNCPEWCRIIPVGTRQLICIRADMVNKFCELYGFEPRNTLKKLEKKDETWLSASDLIKYHIKNGSKLSKKITAALKQLSKSPDRPEWCQKTQVKNRQIICIQANMVNEFCELCGFEPSDCIKKAHPHAITMIIRMKHQKTK